MDLKHEYSSLTYVLSEYLFRKKKKLMFYLIYNLVTNYHL